jgi:hypothetical protein
MKRRRTTYQRPRRTLWWMDPLPFFFIGISLSSISLVLFMRLMGYPL